MKVNYPQTILNRSFGSTNAEAYLSRLCNETFLSLWSFPNIYRDQGRKNSKGDGKELCDLLVVFENHVIIFSDKYCIFPNSGNIQLDWSRWYKRAVRNAADQIYGAERWIYENPDTLYIDSNCTRPFPLAIPVKKYAVVHRIVVAHGASESCINQLGGTGSLMINPNIIEDMHIAAKDRECVPFAIGQINANKGYVHVFDDTSLEIVMSTLDTISDFTKYITKKEEFILSGKLISASGEDDLLAWYLKNIDERGEHTFIAKKFEQVDHISIFEGLWESFCRNPSRLAQIKANEISYSWDLLIEKFIFHITSGTSYLLSHPNLQKQEEVFRYLAKENRTRRRFLAEAFNELIAKTPSNCRTTRAILPSVPGDPHYLLFLLPYQKDCSYDEYRKKRMDLLTDYMKILKLRFPNAIDIIGLATETGLSEDRSEDFMYLNVKDWTEKDNKEALDIENDLVTNGLLGKRKMFRKTIEEYPNNNPTKVKVGMKGSERNKPCPCKSGKKFKYCCGRID
jgi:hypothetical protein